MIDVNKHVIIGMLVEKLTEIGILEVITGKHYNKQGLQPTHQIGSILIDSIFISSSITIQVGGYLPFGLA